MPEMQILIVFADHLLKTKKEFKNLKTAHWDFKDLPGTTASDKVLCDKTFKTAKYSKYGGYHIGLASMAYRFFNKNTAGVAAKNKIMQNKELPEEFHKRIIRKLEKRKVH